MQLSQRMEALAGLVTPGLFLTDVGTDHGYLPVWLCMNGTVPGAVAADINEGPLARAARTVRTYGLSDRIALVLSDGLKNLPDLKDGCILIAGMGGMLVIRILSEGEERLAGAQELVLQPQSDIPLVRAWVSEHGWEITREDLVKEDGKYYPMMQLHRRGQEEGPLTDDLRLRYGPGLLESRHPVLLEYLREERKKLGRILSGLEHQDSPRARERMIELEKELELNAAAFRYFEQT